MSQHTVKIRRGKRSDFPALRALLMSTVAPVQTEAEKTQVRHWRRLASDPSHDFYVAEQEGVIQGVVLVSYIRTLTHQGWQAILDMIVSSSSTSEVGWLLLDFAKMRTRKRGCRHLLVCLTDQERDKRLPRLAQAGFQYAGEMLSCGLS